MKSMKKLVTLLLSLVMLCALAMPAMAAEPTYSITIHGAKNHTYTAYQVFKGVYFLGNGENNTVANKEYLSDVKWGDDVYGTELLTALQASTKFGTDFADKNSAEDVADVLKGYADKSEKLDEFARIVGKHLKPDAAGKKGTIGETESNVTITGLSAGYYFVKDTGTIGDGEIATKFLVRVVGNAEVNIKAEVPKIDKKIVDNAIETNHTSANIGDPVDFKLTVKVPDMASFDTYTFTISDTMSKGLTFDATSVAVKIDETELTAGTGYTLTPPADPAANNTFTITFTKAQLAGHVTNGTGATIVVTYQAALNENALTREKETNIATLTYPKNPSGSEKGMLKTPVTYIYNFNIDVDKYEYDGTDETNTGKKLKNAVFVLYKSDGTGNKYYKWDEVNKKVTWVAEAEKETAATQKKTDATGKATFEGLKAGTYYLEEITAPRGYNKLKAPEKVEIIASYNADGTLNTSVAGCKLTQAAVGNHYYQIQSIANKAGAVLPSTGGIGTTIFYVLGSILVLGAAVLLIVKKRMKDQER